MSVAIAVAVAGFDRHAAPPVPADIWRRWTLDPVVVLLSGLAIALYVRGLRGLRDCGAADRAALSGPALAFGSGVLAVLIALVSPLNALTTALLTAHMSQYLMLTLVAPLLLMLGHPADVLAAGLPQSWARRGAAWRRSPVARRVGAALTLPPVIAALLMATLLVWHVRVVYAAALTNRPLWWLEQISFLVPALLFWRMAVGPANPARGRGHGHLLLSFIAVSLLETAFGIAMYGVSPPWYSVYRTTTAAWGMSPVLDQQVAGLLLAVIDDIPDVLTILALLMMVLSAEEARVEAQERQSAP